MDEQYEVKYDEFNQLNIIRSGPHGEKWWRTQWPSDGLETYDYYGNIIENISIYDVDDYSEGHIIRTSWESYEYTYDSFGNWITREKKDRVKDEPYINLDYYTNWVNNYLNDYSFRGNNLGGFKYALGTDAHVEREIEYYRN